MRRREARWETPFGRWIDSYGVDRLVAALSALGEPISDRAVYSWIAGDHVPRPPLALKLVQLGQGRISLQEIYDHRPSLLTAAAHSRSEVDRAD